MSIPGKAYKVDEVLFWSILWGKVFEMTKTESSRGNENDYEDNYEMAKEVILKERNGLAVLDIHFQIVK